MTHVPHVHGAGQQPALTPHAFVALCEARDAFTDLLTVALDATRPPRRRKLTRREALARVRSARSALAFLFPDAPGAPEAT